MSGVVLSVAKHAWDSQSGFETAEASPRRTHNFICVTNTSRQYYIILYSQI